MFILCVITILTTTKTTTPTTALQPYAPYEWDALYVPDKSVTFKEGMCPTPSNSSVSTTDVFETKAFVSVSDPTAVTPEVTMTDVPETLDQPWKHYYDSLSFEKLWILLKEAIPEFWFFLASGLLFTVMMFYFVYLLFVGNTYKSMTHTIDNVKQKATVHWITVNHKKVPVIQIHAASTGMTPEIESKFFQLYKELVGPYFICGDSNMTLKKCGLSPEEVATKLTELTEFTVFLSKLEINKCRALNSLKNSQNNKGQKKGPDNVDTDGIFWGFHPDLEDYVDTEEMKKQIEAGKICPVTSIDTDSPVDDVPVANAFDSEDCRVLMDHSCVTIYFKDGQSYVVGSGASLYGRCDNAQKSGAAEIVDSFDEKHFTELGNKYTENILRSWNKLLTIACKRCKIAKWNNIGPNATGDESWRDEITPVKKLFSGHLKMFKSDDLLKAAVESFIANMILHQKEIINEYKGNFSKFAKERVGELEKNYRKQIWKNIAIGRFDKLLNIQFIGLETNGGFLGPLQTNELYTQQHVDALGENTGLFIVECDVACHWMTYLKFGLGYWTVAIDGDCHSMLIRNPWSYWRPWGRLNTL